MFVVPPSPTSPKNSTYPSPPSTNTSTCSAAPAKPAQVSLGPANTGNGLQPLSDTDGRTTPDTVGGSTCRTCKMNNHGHAYIYFAIDPKTKSSALKNGHVVVEYFDYGPGQLRMQYDGSKLQDDGHGAYSGSPKTEKMAGEQIWKTASFPFHDAIFKNRQNARADFRLEANGTDLSLRKVTLLRD